MSFLWLAQDYDAQLRRYCRTGIAGIRLAITAVICRKPKRCCACIYILTAVLLRCAASRPVIGSRLPPSNSTQTTDECGVGHDDVGHDSCCVSDAITHDDRPNISSASSQHGAKRRGACGNKNYNLPI